MEHSLSLNNAEYERLAVFIEAAEDRDTAMKQLKMNRQMVIDIAVEQTTRK